MSTPFLFGFAEALVGELITAELIVIHPSKRGLAIRFLANRLGTAATGASLLSSVDKALLECPEVDEVFFDLEGLKEVVERLKTG